MLKMVDETEDRDFAEGETVYDVDGNAYTVMNNRAVLQVDSNVTRSYYLGPANGTMRRCFSRTNPKDAG